MEKELLERKIKAKQTDPYPHFIIAEIVFQFPTTKITIQDYVEVSLMQQQL